jgi:hypothetical protein
VARPVLEPLGAHRAYPPEEMVERVRTFYEDIKHRRTVRDLSDKPMPREVIKDALPAAATNPIVHQRNFIRDVSFAKILMLVIASFDAAVAEAG